MRTGIGPVAVQRVRLRDRGTDRAAERIRFTSAILPGWVLRTRSLNALLPILSLRGVSISGEPIGLMSDLQEAFAALLGKDAPNLSPSVIAQLRGGSEVAIGDGALGFWKAFDKVSPTTRHQRCTVQDRQCARQAAKSVQPAARSDLHEIWKAPDRATAETVIASATFAEKCGAKYEKALTCLVKDRDPLLTFYDFSAEHCDICGRRTRSRAGSRPCGTGRCGPSARCYRTPFG